MPLYSYIMTYHGQTKAHQSRRSNFTGWIIQIVREAFPHLGRNEPALQRAIMGQRPTLVASAIHVWELRCAGIESDFVMHIVETRG